VPGDFLGTFGHEEAPPSKRRRFCLSSYEAILFRRKAAQQFLASRKTDRRNAVPAIRSRGHFPPGELAIKSQVADHSFTIHRTSG